MPKLSTFEAKPIIYNYQSSITAPQSNDKRKLILKYLPIQPNENQKYLDENFPAKHFSKNKKGNHYEQRQEKLFN